MRQRKEESPKLDPSLVVRLDTAVFNAFVKTIPGRMAVPKTDLESAWMNGVEYVLNKLRQDIVVE